MRILTTRYESGQQFLPDVRRDPETGEPTGLTHQTKMQLSRKENVLVEVYFPGLPNRVLLRGTVESIEEGDVPRADVAIWREDLSTLAFLVEQAQTAETSAQDAAARKHDRIPLGIPVDWQVAGSGDMIISSTDDVGAGGLQIRTLSPPPVGSMVTLNLSLEPRSGKTLAIPGKVVWVRQDSEFQGMGVQFMPEEGDQRRQLRELLRRILERGAIGKDE